MFSTAITHRKKSIILGAVLLLGPGATAAQAVVDSCWEGCTRVASYFWEHPEYNVDPFWFFGECIMNNCGQ
jgi:hypothetical protein